METADDDRDRGPAMEASTGAGASDSQPSTESTPQRERDFIAAVLATAGALVVVLDTEGRIVRFNRACERLTGYSFDEVVGEPLWDLFLPPEETEPVKEIYRMLRAGQFPNENENLWVTRDGRHRLIMWSNTALLDEEGSVEYVIGTGIDVTDRRDAEKALRASERKYRQLVEALQEGLWGIDENDLTSFVNDRMAEMLGYSPEEMLGKDLFAFMDARGIEICKRNLERRHEGIREDHEFEFLRKDGTRIYTLLHTAPIMDADGDYQGGIAGVLDISERKRAEEALQEAHAELERRVQAQTRELRNALSAVDQLKNVLEAENLYLREEIRGSHDFGDIVGESQAIRKVLYHCDQVAGTDSTVLILGETGTGKELIAHAIHARSSRAKRPLVKVNSSALPPTLIEDELFGHEKGAFTGAVTARPGRFELADGGTIFLDEIGDLPLELQPKLLRVLQDGEFERLGGTRVHKVDVRVIAATNRDLEKEVAGGAFRPDLYFRLGVFPILLPPLRERRPDIPLLVWYFISKLQREMGKTIEIVPKDVMEALKAYYWPGNVRELQNVIERALILSRGTTLLLDESFKDLGARSETKAEPTNLREVERAHVTRVLEDCGWKIKGEWNAAHRLGLRPSTLRDRMKKLGIVRPGRA